MSSGTTIPPPLLPETPVAARPSECETVIDQRLRETQRHVRGVDIAVGLITMAIGVLSYLLLVALIDHWLIVGGLGFWGRLGLWLALVAAAAVYFGVELLPPLRNRINPVFAAATIEQSQPSLKNSLINFLLLRGRRQEVAQPVYQAMERRAAADLGNAQLDVAVDRSHLIRLGCILAGVLAVFCLYLVVSPKNPIRSAARVLWPWSSIEAPTRVTIHDIQPGNVTAFHGDFVTISAEIAGLREGEQALLIYSTADGQTTDQTIPLALPEDEYRYQCRLPPGNLGLQQTYDYRLAAGDCRTARYRIDVQIAPAITVDKVSYHYPPYTRIADRTVERQGDLSAIEGTEVTVQATANTEIKPHSAEIDLGCTGRQGRRMTVDDRTATGHFTLRPNPKDASGGEYNEYQLRFADLQGRENQRPIRHRIDVIRDLPPTVQWIEPDQKDVPLAVNETLTIKALAEDPDFGLRRIVLHAQCNGQNLPIAPLLETKSTERARSGECSVEYAFEPTTLKLKVGDRVEYWVEAEDAKEPTPNRAASDKRWITIVGSDAQKQANEDRLGHAKGNGRDQPEKGTPNQTEKDRPPEGKQPAEAQPGQKGEPNEPPQEQPDPSKGGEKSGSPQSGQGTDKSESGKPGEKKGGAEPQAGQSGEKNNERIDPDTAPGDAIQEILNDREKQQQGQTPTNQAKPGEQPQSDQKPDQDKKPDQGSNGEKQTGDEKSANQKPSDQKGPKEPKGKGEDQKTPSGGGGAGESESEDQSDNADNKQGSKGTGGKKAEGKEPSEEPSSDADAGDEKDGAGQGGAKKTTADKPGDHEGTDDNPQGDKPSGDGVTKDKPGSDTTGGEPSGSAAGGKGLKPSDGEKKPGEQPPDQQNAPGAGQNAGDDKGPPMPQTENGPRDKKPGQSDNAPGEKKGDPAKSPGTSKKESDSQSDTAGDRTGGGAKGGGQQANQPGVGGPGSHTPADEGGSASDEPGNGEIGDKPGDTAASKSPTGSEKNQPSPDGHEGEAKDGKTPGGKSLGPSDKKPDQPPTGDKSKRPDDSTDQGTSQEKPADGATPRNGSSEGPKARGTGTPTAGGKPDDRPADATPPEPIETGADQANLEYAQRQSALALEHLRDQLAKEKPNLLDRLGWTKDDAQRFIERWEQMQRAAAQKGPDGDAARKHLNDALRSLGLRPRGAELRHGGIKIDEPENLRDAGQFAPPPDWAEQFREYTRGVSEGDRKDK